MRKIGQVWSKKDGTGHFIALGSGKNKNPKYNLSVEITVKDSEGNVLLTQTDGLLSLVDPRTQENANLESLSRVPNLVFEILASDKK